MSISDGTFAISSTVAARNDVAHGVMVNENCMSLARFSSCTKQWKASFCTKRDCDFINICAVFRAFEIFY